MATINLPLGLKVEFTAACPSRPGETPDELRARMVEAGVPLDRMLEPEPHPTDPDLFMIAYIREEG